MDSMDMGMGMGMGMRACTCTSFPFSLLLCSFQKRVSVKGSYGIM